MAAETLRTAILTGIALALGATAAQAASATPEMSLANCQKKAAKEAATYARRYQKAVAGCLDKIATECIQNPRELIPQRAEGAAKTCVAKLRQVVNTDDGTKTLEAKATAKIEKYCSPDYTAGNGSKPNTHSNEDLLGTGATVQYDPIQAEDLAEWCGHFEGGAFNDPNSILSDWTSCMLTAATCQARQQLSVQYPEMLKWLAEIRADIDALDDALDPGNSYVQKVADALDALDQLDEAVEGVTPDNVPEINCGPGPAALIEERDR